MGRRSPGAGRAGFFHSDHRLATLWAPIDKMVPLLPIPTAGLLSNVRLKTWLVWLYLVRVNRTIRNLL